jgi:hypothetical protein
MDEEQLLAWHPALGLAGLRVNSLSGVAVPPGIFLERAA